MSLIKLIVFHKNWFENAIQAPINSFIIEEELEITKSPFSSLRCNHDKPSITMERTGKYDKSRCSVSDFSLCLSLTSETKV